MENQNGQALAGQPETTATENVTNVTPEALTGTEVPSAPETTAPAEPADNLEATAPAPKEEAPAEAEV